MLKIKNGNVPSRAVELKDNWKFPISRQHVCFVIMLHFKILFCCHLSVSKINIKNYTLDIVLKIREIQDWDWFNWELT